MSGCDIHAPLRTPFRPTSVTYTDAMKSRSDPRTDRTAGRNERGARPRTPSVSNTAMNIAIACGLTSSIDADEHACERGSPDQRPGNIRNHRPGQESEKKEVGSLRHEVHGVGREREGQQHRRREDGGSTPLILLISARKSAIATTNATAFSDVMATAGAIDDREHGASVRREQWRIDPRQVRIGREPFT